MTDASRRRTMVIPTLSAILSLLIIAGCASTPDAELRDPVMTEWSRPLASSTGQTAASRGPMPTPSTDMPPALVASPMEAAAIARSASDRALPTNIITDLELTEDADVVTVLRTLAKAAGVNLLVSPQVSGTVSFTFKNLPWDQAFRSIINAAGLTYSWEHDVLRVMNIDDIKRSLELETALKEREGVRAEKRLIEPMVIQVIPIRYAKAKTIGATIKNLLASSATSSDAALSISGRSSVSVDEENNAVIVHAIREDVEKMVALVEQLDRVKWQIHIEARFVEATRDTARQLGVQWSASRAFISDGRATSVGGAGVTPSGYNSAFPAQFAQGVAPPAGFAMGVISEKLGGSELLNMQLTALQQKGRINILSSPSITTLDNEPAVIESGEERAYRETSGTGNDQDVSIQWKKAVLKLEVVPHVIDGEHMRVEIIANKDSFDETKPQSNNEFPVNTKNARTTVLLRNGETVVIGGLSVESKSDVQSGIPLLMDIPAVGNLFKNRSKAQKFDDTLIFITPKIVTGPR